MMDPNTSLPSILTSKHFFAVSVICFDRSDFAYTCFSGKFILIKGRFFLISILSASVLVILLKSSSSLKSSNVMLLHVDTP